MSVIIDSVRKRGQKGGGIHLTIKGFHILKITIVCEIAIQEQHENDDEENDQNHQRYDL